MTYLNELIWRVVRGESREDVSPPRFYMLEHSFLPVDALDDSV